MSKLRVCGHRILVRVTLEEVNKGLKNGEYIKDGHLYSAGGTILEKIKIDNEQRGVETGTVIELGPEAYDIKTGPWCKVGDLVFFTRYVGKEIKGDLVGEPGVTYIVMNDEEVMAVVEQ